MKLLAGKLPPDLLKELLASLPPADASVLVGSGVGEDAAVIDNGGSELLVAKSDPITFAANNVGRYLLAVNGNDLATMGAEPRWLLVTALLPEGIEVSAVRGLFADVAQACRDCGVALVGGHTEVTVGLDRPILSGCLLGSVPRDKVIRTAGARVGDAILLTAGVAIEGTAILASEHAPTLRERGVPDDVIARASGWTTEPGISVLPAARVLREVVDVHSMHDPTEGGVITALHEIAEAAGVGLRVAEEEMVVLDDTRVICDALGLDPMGLLASGALLATVDPSSLDAAIAALKNQGIPAACIGTIVEREAGRCWATDGSVIPLPAFARDELPRFLTASAQGKTVDS